MPKAEVVSNRFINHLVHTIVTDAPDINLALFLTEQPVDPRIDNVDALNKKRFLHSTLLNDVIFPLQRKNYKTLPGNVLLPPDLLANKYNNAAKEQRIRIVPNVNPNDSKFIEQEITNNEALKMSVSVRNLVVFKERLINAHKERCGPASLLNVHPGNTEQIKGLESPWWTRKHGLNEYMITLHEAAREIDTGDIIDYVATTINGYASKSVATYQRDTAPEISKMVAKHIHTRLIANGENKGISLGTKNKNEGRYETLPTQDQIHAGEKKGIKLIDRYETLSYLQSHYANEGTHPLQFAAIRDLLELHTDNFTQGIYKKPHGNSFQDIKEEMQLQMPS